MQLLNQNWHFYALFSWKNIKLAPIEDILLFHSSSTSLQRQYYCYGKITAVIWESQYIDHIKDLLRNEYLSTLKILIANMRFSEGELSWFFFVHLLTRYSYSRHTISKLVTLRITQINLARLPNLLPFCGSSYKWNNISESNHIYS